MRGIKVTPGRLKLFPLASTALTIAPFYQSEAHPDSYFTGSPFQFSVRLFSITLHVAVSTHSDQRPSYRSQGWTVYVHPEGRRYAHYDRGDGVSVVTEAYVTDPRIAEQLEGCIAMIRAVAVREDVQLPATTDLFLEIDEDMGNCSYWFADHAHRTIFWVHSADTNTLGLPDSYSGRHLRESYSVFTSSSELKSVG